MVGLLKFRLSGGIGDDARKKSSRQQVLIPFSSVWRVKKGRGMYG